MNERRNCLPGAFHTSFRWFSSGSLTWSPTMAVASCSTKTILRAALIEPRHFPLAKNANTVSGRSHALSPGSARSDATQTGTRGSP